MVSDEVWEDAEGVHAEACDSSSLGTPELVTLLVNTIQDHVVQLASITLLEFDLTVLVLAEVGVNLKSEVDHLLADLDADEHVVVIEYLGEQLSSAHADLDDGHLVVGLFDLSQHALEELDLVLEQLTHAGVLGLLGVNGVSPDEWRHFFPNWVSVVLLLAAGALVGWSSVFWKLTLNLDLHF